MSNEIPAAKCFPFFHMYTRWSITEELLRSKDKARVGDVYERVCIKCGKVQKYSIRIDK